MSAIIEQTSETYGIENWGADYFGINRKGHLVVRAPEGENLVADVKEIIDDLTKRGVTTPSCFSHRSANFSQHLRNLFANSNIKAVISASIR